MELLVGNSSSAVALASAVPLPHPQSVQPRRDGVPRRTAASTPLASGTPATSSTPECSTVGRFRPRALLPRRGQLDKLLPPDHQGAGEACADRLCRTHSQTLAQLARDAPASLRASSDLSLATLLLGGSDLGRNSGESWGAPDEEGRRIESRSLAPASPRGSSTAARPPRCSSAGSGTFYPGTASRAAGRMTLATATVVGEAGCGLVRQRARGGRAWMEQILRRFAARSGMRAWRAARGGVPRTPRCTIYTPT